MIIDKTFTMNRHHAVATIQYPENDELIRSEIMCLPSDHGQATFFNIPETKKPAVTRDN